MAVTGIIFSNLHDTNISELTSKRTMASVPFGCRYRLVDFALSNLVNSGVSDVNVITHYNYQSLMDHIGSGKDWDLARRSGGLKILPPYITAFSNENNRLYSSRLEALMSIQGVIASLTCDTVVLCVSKDLPFAQSRFCTTEGIENVVALSVFRCKCIDEKYGITLTDGPLRGLLARAVVVVDETGKIVYEQLVDEITHEPDYEAALAVLK